MCRQPIHELFRWYAADRAVWANFVVVSAPMLQLFKGVGKRQEPMGVHAFRSKLAVERFEEAIVRRFELLPNSWTDFRVT